MFKFSQWLGFPRARVSTRSAVHSIARTAPKGVRPTSQRRDFRCDRHELIARLHGR